MSMKKEVAKKVVDVLIMILTAIGGFLGASAASL